MAYLDMRIRTPVYTTGDILGQVLLRAFESYAQKPKDLTLEQWLYQLANEMLENYVGKRASIDSKGRSLETLNAKELSTLEEKPLAEAEGEPILEEDPDDISCRRDDFSPSQGNETPEQILEIKEELHEIMRALSRLPLRDQLAFELLAMEGCSTEEVP